MNRLILQTVVNAFLLAATIVIVCLFFAAFDQAQGQTPYTYTVPMLQDTVVVVTNTSIHTAEVKYRWYDSMGIYMEWQSGSFGMFPNQTVAKWYCLPVGDDPWFSLQLTSTVPLAIEKYMDKEIAQGYGCP